MISIDKKFVEVDQESFYAVMVEYDMQGPDSKYDRKERVDYSKILEPRQFARFNELREYRS